MKRLLACITLVLAGTCGLAFAAVTPLPGVSPQSAPAGAVFDVPIAVRVTDDDGRPVPGAWVGWTERYLAPISLAPCPNSAYDAGVAFCSVQAGADGVALLGRASSYWSETRQFSVTASSDRWRNLASRDYGHVAIELTSVPVAPLAQLTIVSGSGQRAVVGTRYRDPIVARVTQADGRTAGTVRVSFRFPFAAQPIARFTDSDTGFGTSAAANAGGEAVSAPIVAQMGLGDLVGIVEYQDNAAKATVSTTFTLTQTDARGLTELALQDMWWTGPHENGWGMAVAQRDGMLFNVVFAYDDAGAPTWWVMPGGEWAYGMGSIFAGPLYEARGAPYFAYDPARFELSLKAIRASLDFGGVEGSGTLRVEDYWDPNRPSVNFSKPIVRTDFSMDAAMPFIGVGGLWWGGPSQNGWGVTIMEQQGSLFIVWLTYGADGKATWFVMPSGEAQGDAWVGPIYRARGAPWFNQAYDASRLSLSEVGRYRIAFEGTDRATFEWSVDGHSGRVPIEKQAF